MYKAYRFRMYPNDNQRKLKDNKRAFEWTKCLPGLQMINPWLKEVDSCFFLKRIGYPSLKGIDLEYKKIKNKVSTVATIGTEACGEGRYFLDEAGSLGGNDRMQSKVNF